MSNLILRPAARQSARLLIGLYGESGSGKTKSALLLARGMAGTSGKVRMIDTESGRGEFFADEIPGGYEVIPMDSPFSPQRGVDGLALMEQQGTDVGIIDSCSHFWEGIGGVLDLAAENEEAGKKALAIWRKPKLEHAKFVLKLMQAKMTVIVCLRAKHKSRQVKNAKGFTEIVKDEHLTPIQAEDFLFELTMHMQVNPDHTVIVTKKGRADLRACLPDDYKEPLTIAHGEAIARWAKGDSTPAPKKGPSADKLRERLWEMTNGRFVDQPEFSQYLWDEGFMDPDSEVFGELTAERLMAIGPKLKTKLENAQ